MAGEIEPAEDAYARGVQDTIARLADQAVLEAVAAKTGYRSGGERLAQLGNEQVAKFAVAFAAVLLASSETRESETT